MAFWYGFLRSRDGNASHTFGMCDGIDLRAGLRWATPGGDRRTADSFDRTF